VKAPALPHSEELERSVLAVAILDPALFRTTGGSLVAEDFYLERHRSVFAAVRHLQEDGASVDLQTVVSRLEERGELEHVGGIAFVSTLDTDLPSISHIETYVDRVRELAARRQGIAVAAQLHRDLQLGGDETDAALAKASRALRDVTQRVTRAEWTPIGEAVGDAVDMQGRAGRSGVTGIPSSLVDVDRILHGFHRGELCIIGGRPGQGKTTFAMNIAAGAALAGYHIAVVSLEMSTIALATKALCSEARVPVETFERGFVTNDQWGRLNDVAKRLFDAPLWLDDSPSATLRDVIARVRRLASEKESLDMVVVDYLQLLAAEPGRRETNRNLELGEMTRAFKGLAREMGIPVIVLSQLSRAPERRGDPRPTPADLRESGNLEQDADVILFVFREEVYLPDREDLKGKAQILVGKNRNGQSGVAIDLVFDAPCQRFADPARQGRPF
jgi:replicative DNA helicase